MPVLDIVKSLFIKPETKAVVGVDSIGRTNSLIFTSAGGGNFQVSYNANANDAQLSTTFYSIVSAIQTTAKTIPWAVYKVNSKDEAAEKLPDSPLANLLYRPNSYQSWSQFIVKYISQYLSTGNAFIYFMEAGSASELHVMPLSTEVVAGSSWAEPVAGYRVTLAAGGYQSFALEQVIHIKTSSFQDSLYGISPVAVGALAINALNNNMKQRVYQLARGGPGRVFWNASGADVEPLTEEQERDLYLKIKNQREYTYLNNPIGTAQIGLSPVDLDLLNSMAADAGTLADLLHYPSVLLSGSKSTTYSNYNEARKALYNDCIIPLLYDLKEGLNFRLGAVFGDHQYIDFDLSTIDALKPNTAALIASVSSANFLTIDEKRGVAGFEALPTGAGGGGFLLSAADVYSSTINEEHDQPQPDTYAAGDSSVEGD